MADEELHKTGASDPEGQVDWQSDAENAHIAQPGDDADTAANTDTKTTTKTAAQDDEDDYGIPMDKVEAVLNASIDQSAMTPQMQRMVRRQEENTRRVEETIKGTKANPTWFVPLFCVLMVIGLAWAVVYYLTGDFPIPNIGAWNLAIAFAILMVGFLMTMWWR
ncbi:MAG: cell division protein CrgA [Bifidobacterium subtile]|jgi:hypothetical protein|nr:cell division protein CrgA [Bifidobacterium subtile]